MLETLLLLSCRDLGVDFVLIDNDNDDKKKHVAMEKIMCEVDIAFDATGNQFSMNEPVSESIDEKKNNAQVSTHWTDLLFDHPTLIFNPAIDIFKTNNVIFTQINTTLHFYYFKRLISAVF